MLNNNFVRAINLDNSGGGMIEDFVKDGHYAIGLEGSDYSLRTQRAAWSIIPDNLFTCDCSKPFQITYDNKPILFDIITAWEVMEHFHMNDLSQVFKKSFHLTSCFPTLSG